MDDSIFTTRYSKLSPDLKKPLPPLPAGAVRAEAVAEAREDHGWLRTTIGPPAAAMSLELCGMADEVPRIYQHLCGEDQRQPNAPSLYFPPTNPPRNTAIRVFIPANLNQVVTIAQLSQTNSLLLPLGLESFPFIDLFQTHNKTAFSSHRCLLYSDTTTLRQLRLQLLHLLHHAGAVLGLQIVAASSSQDDAVAEGDASGGSIGGGSIDITSRKDRAIRMRLGMDGDGNDVICEKRAMQEAPGQWNLAKAKAVFLAHVARRMGIWNAEVELVADRPEKFGGGAQKQEREGEIEIINWP
ncbi:MAG: hypothetical protein FE78DRAFT_27046 [Acidomyces sp. 'richmondensis']|nr:MAG: hypothetical protein FE78DRAFT_27046 [Acidomyces sp. 'richmondensis']